MVGGKEMEVGKCGRLSRGLKRMLVLVDIWG
jgi:hypothetical protein